VYESNVQTFLTKHLACTLNSSSLASTNYAPASKVLNIGYRDRIRWGLFISDIEYRERYQGYACISSVLYRTLYNEIL